MTFDQLPAAVRAFIHDHVRSIEQLEVLLLLHKDVEQWWSAQGVAGELRTSLPSAAARLEDLACRNLLAVRTADQLFYRYLPISPALDLAVRETAQAYRERPAAVAALLYSTPLDEIRGFADAFRIRKRKENGG
jgi:hypothetical protein